MINIYSEALLIFWCHIQVRKQFYQEYQEGFTGRSYLRQGLTYKMNIIELWQKGCRDIHKSFTFVNKIK